MLLMQSSFHWQHVRGYSKRLTWTPLMRQTKRCKVYSDKPHTICNNSLHSERELSHLENEKSDVNLCSAKTIHDAFNLANCARECPKLASSSKSTYATSCQICSIAQMQFHLNLACSAIAQPASDTKFYHVSAAELNARSNAKPLNVWHQKHLCFGVSLEQAYWTNMSSIDADMKTACLSCRRFLLEETSGFRRGKHIWTPHEYSLLQSVRKTCTRL